MAQGSTLYRFEIALSDVYRSVYETLDFRVARHSSESDPFLLTRVIAFALNWEEALEFSPGLCTPDEPAIRVGGSSGEIRKWIDIGNPSARRVHRASKASKAVRIYTYKDPENLKRELEGEEIHRRETIEIFSLDSAFLDELGKGLGRSNEWSLLHNDGELVITFGDKVLMSRVFAHSITK